MLAARRNRLSVCPSAATQHCLWLSATHASEQNISAIKVCVSPVSRGMQCQLYCARWCRLVDRKGHMHLANVQHIGIMRRWNGLALRYMHE